MKKSAKPAISKILFLLMVITAVVLGNVGLRFKYEELMRKKVGLVKTIKDERTRRVNLIAEYQEYSSEKRIVEVAENKLGMVRRVQPKISISVDKNLINEVNDFLKAKYE